MIILVVLILMVAGGIVWFLIDDSFVALSMAVLGGVGLLICIILFIIYPMMINGEIHEYYSIKNTLETARKTESIENATIQLKIIQVNEWLASTQYYNSTAFGLWIPNEIDDLEILK